MGLADRIRGAGRVAAAAVGDALVDWASADLQKSNGKAPAGGAFPTEPAENDPKTLFWDPFAIVEQLGYKERASQISYGTLKAIAYRVPIIPAILQTRINQVAAFSSPQHDRYQLGYRVKLRDTEKEPTRVERRWRKDAEMLLQRTGVTDNPRGRDNFETFLRKLTWDTLVYDQMCFEVVPNRKKQPAEWYAVDAASMRLADTASTVKDEDDASAVRYVQIYDGMIVSEYTQEELCFGVRNPRTDMRLYGYGVSELETLMKVVTALLWGWEYNQRAFSQGSVHKGVLNFKGAIPEKQLRAFRRHWYMMLSGVENAWRTPITNAEDLQWVSMHQSNRDMEYNAWMDFLIKVACSQYSMDPVEVNFKYGNVGQQSGLTEASNREKITDSKERGLRPLLRFFASCINQYLIWPMSEDFEFEFVGLDAKTPEDMAELNTKRVKSTRTIDELRAEDDLPPLPDGKGEIILDPTWVQFVSAQAAQEQQGEVPEEESAGGDGGNGKQIDFESLLDEGNGEDNTEQTRKSVDPQPTYVLDVRL